MKHLKDKRLFWKEELDVELSSLSDFHIDVVVKGEVEFCLTLFYGNPRANDRTRSWELLRRLKKETGRPWLVMGDFNEIAFRWEMESHRERQAWQMRNFRDCLEACELSDMGFKGEPFTYSNRRKGEQEVRARLDRMVANTRWRMAFPKAVVKHGFANSSDHVPLILYTKGDRKLRYRKLKRFEPMWLRHERFKEEVRSCWISQSSGSSLSEKLKKCMQHLHQWNSSAFGNVKKKVENLKEKIQQIRVSPRTEETAAIEANLMDELDEWLEREELWWRQRSRAEWLRNGDRNTAYFHSKASQRRRRNYIERIKDQTGEVCESENQITSIITDYFRGIFQSQVDNFSERWSREFEGIPKLVTEDMNAMLTAPFSEGEVKRALYQMHPSKAPGLDGFSAMFYQVNWDIVGPEVVKEVLNCLNNNVLNKELNETLIVLVPKVKKVEKVEDFRPISLCNVVMKIVTKVLANRLKLVLPEIISQNQSAFIGGRLITDNILIAHEISHCMKAKTRQKTGFMSLKLDMSKAYDRIEWKFLEKMMLQLGFAECWVKKIMLCVESVSYKVKINDHISNIIWPSRGLRQGDPISPYLFLICAEWLTHTINMYREMGLLEGIRVGKRAPIITHLMFADDCMFFLKAKQESVTWISDVLRRYEAVSGQKVNYTKSEGVCSSNVDETFRRAMADRLQIRIVNEHSVYLGLPLIFGNKKVSLLRSVEEKILRKVGDWKYKLLSGAGREILIKSILQAIPLYAMSCFRIPISLCNKMAGDITKFWWHGSKNKGIHWLRMKQLYKEKGIGGLGFRDLRLMNLALLAKQGWRVLTKPNLLVSKVFKARYFPNDHMLGAAVGTRPSYAWRGIHEAFDIIKSGAVWDVGENRYYWRLDGSGELTVKSAYQEAVRMERHSNTYEGEQSDMAETKRFWRSFWRLKVPHKLKIFGWRLYHDALPTLQNLERRGCSVVNICWHCGTCRENSMHMFRDCSWMKSLLQGWNIPQEVWENQCDNPGYWLWLCAKLCSEKEFISLLYGLWLGWKNRNDIAHGKEGSNIQTLQLRMRWLMKEWKNGMNEPCWWDIQKDRFEEELVILCDGSYDQENREAGVGAVVLHKGAVSRAKAEWVDNVNSVLEAECKAIRLGMMLASELELRKVTIFSDSREAIWALSLGSWRSGAYNMEVLRCIGILDEHPNWALGSISRESNTIADWLARKARMEKWSWSGTGPVPV
ncbi:unnamed protein product [Rhodiola kirilowii]